MCHDIGLRSHFGGNYHEKLRKLVRIFSIQGFRLFDISIDMVLTFEFGHDITILKMAIFNQLDNIEIEPALA